MTVAPSLVSRSPELYPHSYDLLGDAVYLMPMSEADFRAASFLDQRAITPGKSGAWRPWAEVAQAAARLGPARRSDYIFHISHVGSTLLSRLLGAHASILALREPNPLRSLAVAHADLATPESPLSPNAFAERLSTLVRLWSRTWTPDQTTLIKATSLACALAGDLLAGPGDPRAILMYVPPEAFLASILVAPNSPIDIRNAAQLRLRRLHARLGEAPWRLWELSLGETVAMSWACEMLTLGAAAAGDETRVHWVEFDTFLADPDAGLTTCFSHLGVAVATDQIRDIVNSPLMHQYAKAPEHAYDRALRREVLASGRARQAAEIRRGLAWLDAAATRFPPIAEALALAAHPGRRQSAG